jgi:hypothetical protein
MAKRKTKDADEQERMQEALGHWNELTSDC